MPRYKHPQLEVIAWPNAYGDPRNIGTGQEKKSDLPQVFQPIYAVVGEDLIVELDFDTEDESGVEVEVLPLYRADYDEAHETGECLKLDAPIPVKPDYIGFVDAGSDENKYVPWKEAIERINAFVSVMRPKGDEAYRAGDREAAGEIYANLVSVSHLANDLARCILVEDNDGIRQTFIELLRTSYERLLGHPSSEEGLTEFIEGVRAEITSTPP